MCACNQHHWVTFLLLPVNKSNTLGIEYEYKNAAITIFTLLIFLNSLKYETQLHEILNQKNQINA